MPVVCEGRRQENPKRQRRQLGAASDLAAPRAAPANGGWSGCAPTACAIERDAIGLERDEHQVYSADLPSPSLRPPARGRGDPAEAWICVVAARLAMTTWGESSRRHTALAPPGHIPL